MSVALKTPPKMNEENETRTQGVNLRYLLQALLKHGASDLHLKSDRPPLYRINGKLVPAKMSSLSAEQIKELLLSGLTLNQKNELYQKMQLDCSLNIEGMGRFRINLFFQKGLLSSVIRMIPVVIPSLESLGIPSIVKELSQKKRGLVLITGSTGTGKSTTLASMVDYINEHRHAHIITIEDPIEFLFHDKKSSISQREIGTDTLSVEDALFGGLRQDPDVICIGELRSAASISTALTAAETGHLVLSTLHTADAKTSLNRILECFEGAKKNEARVQLASSLQAVISQKLVQRADGNGRVVVCEVMVKSPTIENLILNNELDKIDEAISSSTTYYKMQTFNQALEKLVLSNIIKNEDAIFSSNSPDDLKMRLSGFKREEKF